MEAESLKSRTVRLYHRRNNIADYHFVIGVKIMINSCVCQLFY